MVVVSFFFIFPYFHLFWPKLIPELIPENRPNCLYLPKIKQRKTKENKKNMAQSEYRSDGTRYISKDSKDNPKLGAKLLIDGCASLFLEYYDDYTAEKSKSGKEYKSKTTYHFKLRVNF